MRKYGMSEAYSEILLQSKFILNEYSLCDNCLGRFFIKLSGFSSSKRLGSKIKNSIKYKTVTKCYICKDIFSITDFYVRLMQDASIGYEFSSFLVGGILKRSIIERDDKIRSKFRLRGTDGIKTEITRELGKRFARKTNTNLDYLLPDITFTINFRTERCEVKTRSLFLYGRYIKKNRGLSQKQGSCKDCNGKGCIFCNNHGIVFFDSIEGKICQFLYKKFETEQVKFTWIGGEDKTSLVMGNGRPFFVKILSPKKRKVRLTKKSDLCEIVLHGLRIIDNIPRGSITFRSKIKLLVAAKNNISSKKLKKLKQLSGAQITLTDADRKQMKKTIHKLKYNKNSLRSFTIHIEADGGLPIKHFVDGIHVIPNISSALGIHCVCQKFDINQIVLSK